METIPLISVITPSTRNEMLPIVEKCLKRQTFRDFEWIIVSPVKITSVKPTVLLKDPPKKPGDYYTLCSGWNVAFSEAKGELIVNIQDGIWFPPDLLERFWYHFEADPRGCVGAIGHQYDDIDSLGMPTHMMWKDPRVRNRPDSFFSVDPAEIEFTVNSIPKQALIDCGGMDEEYDKGAAVGEKEMSYRMAKLGYNFYLDLNLEYRAIHHPRLNSKWDSKYKISCDLFTKHARELDMGTRKLNVGYLTY